jgi:hypothetical protein
VPGAFKRSTPIRYKNITFELGALNRKFWVLNGFFAEFVQKEGFDTLNLAIRGKI